MPRQRLHAVPQPPGLATAPDSPRKRLQRVGPTRVANAVKAARHLAQLANPQVYELRPGDREKIVEALTTEVEQLDYSLANPGKVAPIVNFDDE